MVTTTRAPVDAPLAGARSSVREQTVLLCCVIATAQMTWGVVVPALPLYLDRYHLAVGTLGPIIAAFAVGRAVANVPAGLALRRWEPRRYLWVVVVALGVVTALTGLAASAPAIVAMRFVAGVFGGAAVTVAFAVLVGGAPEGRRGSVVATSMVAMMSAAAAGSVLGGVAVSLVGVRWTFVVAVLPLALCLVWERLRPATHYWAVRTTAPAPGGGRVRGARGLLVGLCAVSFATFFVRFAGEQGLVPVLAYDSAGLTPVTLSVAMAVGTVASLAATPWVGRRVDAGARGAVLVPGGVAGALAVLVLPLVGAPVPFALAMAVYTVATTALNVVPSVVAGERWPAREQGAVVGLTRTVGDAGAAVGPLVVFWAVDASGAMLGCVLMATVLAASVLALGAMLRSSRVPEAPVDAA